MYADDAIIYTSHSSFPVIETILTTEIKGISEWMNENRLIINLKKGKPEPMLFGTAKRLTATVPLEIFIDDKLINFVKGYKYLGTWLDPCVNMSEHLEKVFKKASSRLRLLSRMRRSLTKAAAESNHLTNYLVLLKFGFESI